MQIQSGLSFGSFNANPMLIQNFDLITNAKLGPRPQLGAHCQLVIGIVCAVGPHPVRQPSHQQPSQQAGTRQPTRRLARPITTTTICTRVNLNTQPQRDKNASISAHPCPHPSSAFPRPRRPHPSSSATLPRLPRRRRVLVALTLLWGRCRRQMCWGSRRWHVFPWLPLL